MQPLTRTTFSREWTIHGGLPFKTLASMKLPIAIGLFSFFVSSFACGSELVYQGSRTCGKCPSDFTPGTVTTENDLCTTGTPYPISTGAVTLNVQGNKVVGSFLFPSYRVFGDDTEHLFCQDLKEIGGEFKGTLKGNVARISYLHSWNTSGEFDTAEILIKSNQIVWRSIGLQHGYLGMMPASIKLSRRVATFALTVPEGLRPLP